MIEDLRRTPRVSLCSRAVVRDRYGIWSAVTDDVCGRGCQIVTNRMLRVGSTVEVTLSTDLFADELEIRARVVWASQDRIGLAFLADAARGAMQPDAWLAKVLEHGSVHGSTTRVVPSVQRGGPRVLTGAAARNGRLVRTPSPLPAAAENEIRVLHPVSGA